MAEFEETKHYGGVATVKFYPGNHAYYVNDPAVKAKNKRTGGGTSITGMLGKGEGLMKWPMWEMSKYLEEFFATTTITEVVNGPVTIEDLLEAGRDAHIKKSDRGKSVGTDAHAWIEEWSRLKLVSQHDKTEFTPPPIPDVEDIAAVLRRSYIDIIKRLKPKAVDEWKKLPALIMKDIEVREAMWTEATMVRQSIMAAKEWLDQHEIFVHGAEDTVYSRELFVCGKYDADWSVTCSEKCGWCYMNGANSTEDPSNGLESGGRTFVGRYIVDFKSTNASSSAPKGIYPEYLVQCAVYDVAIMEEHPEREYHGYLILNGSKKPFIDKAGNEHPLFNTHFSFDRKRWQRVASMLAVVKEDMFAAGKEIKRSA
jgi:hypothetical protein